MASSSALLVLDADDSLAVAPLDGPGVDADLGGARTTTDAGLPSSLVLALPSLSFSSACLSNISLLLLFLSDFDLINIFPVAFLSAVFLFL